MSFMQLKNGLQLYYQDLGAGKPVVFVHGWCINSDSWEYVVNELPARGIRSILYDQRGCGRSDKPVEGYDYTTLAGDLAGLMFVGRIIRMGSRNLFLMDKSLV
jgi:non-heme chloroperoxidase